MKGEFFGFAFWGVHWNVLMTDGFGMGFDDMID